METKSHCTPTLPLRDGGVVRERRQEEHSVNDTWGMEGDNTTLIQLPRNVGGISMSQTLLGDQTVR
jgi:hypothetical protein